VIGKFFKDKKEKIFLEKVVEKLYQISFHLQGFSVSFRIKSRDFFLFYLKGMRRMDLEEITRNAYRKGKSKEEILKKLKEIAKVKRRQAELIYKEIEFSESLPQYLETHHDTFLELLTLSPTTGYTAGETGLGCRGEGDYLIHQLISKIIGENKASSSQEIVVGATQLDDGGIVRLHKQGELYISLAVDGIHSRLSHYPFLAGFHVARAALRDVLAMGALPFALFSDIHLGNQGDPSKIFEYVSGISTVADSFGVPYLCGSTLRIGGDLVGGERLTGSAGAAGLVVNPHIGKRTATRPGDLLIMTEGSGGGTITTTAIFNGFYHVVEKTMDIDFLELGRAILTNPDILRCVHTIMDITNGGIKGDVFALSQATNCSVVLYKEKILSLVEPSVLKMLNSLRIDALSISIDSMLLSTPNQQSAQKLLNFIREMGYRAEVVGEIGERGEELVTLIHHDGRKEKLKMDFREAPYTPVKKMLGTAKPPDFDKMKKALLSSVEKSIEKKKILIEYLKMKKKSKI